MAKAFLAASIPMVTASSSSAETAFSSTLSPDIISSGFFCHIWAISESLILYFGTYVPYPIIPDIYLIYLVFYVLEQVCSLQGLPIEIILPQARPTQLSRLTEESYFLLSVQVYEGQPVGRVALSLHLLYQP